MSDVDDTQASTPKPSGRGFDVGVVIANRYVVRRAIASGGMGSVFEVHDTQLKEIVALKTLDDRLDDDISLARFQGEVKSARRISHPNVCRVFDFGVHTHEGRSTYFLTMELLSGSTLASLLEQGRIPRAELLDVMDQVASGLDAAHAAGVVHRDLKPSNVMLVPTAKGSRAVVTDFGIARRLDESSVTKEGWVGTPAYIAPEQLRGQQVGPATDVYSFGVMLFEAVTGRWPFVGDTAVDVAIQRLSNDAPRTRSIDPSVPTAWDAAIAGCLEREASKRWNSARAVIQAMRGGVELTPTPSRPRRRTRAPLLGLGVLTLAAGLVLFATRSRLPSHDRIVAVRVRPAAGEPGFAMPRDFPSFEQAAAYVMRREWKRLETQRRFRIAPGEDGNVDADVVWRRDGEHVLAVLELRADGALIRRTEKREQNFAALAKEMFRDVSTVVGADQPTVDLFPEERSDLERLRAPDPDAYKEFVDALTEYLISFDTESDILLARFDALIAKYPQWVRPVVVRATKDGPATSPTKAFIDERRTNLDASDQVGLALLEVIENNRANSSLDVSDLSVALVAAIGSSSGEEDRVAVERKLANTWPGLQFSAAFVGSERVAGRPESAERELRTWLAKSPGQIQAWRSMLATIEHPGLDDAYLLLFERDAASMHFIASWSLQAGKVDRAELFVRESADSPRRRAYVQYILGLAAVLRGQLAQAIDRLTRAWTLASEELGHEFAWIQVARELTRICEVLGRTEDARRWRSLEIERMQQFAWDPGVVAAIGYANAIEGSRCPDAKPFLATLRADQKGDAHRFITRLGRSRGCTTCAEVLSFGTSPFNEFLRIGTVEYLKCALESEAHLAVARDVGRRQHQVQLWLVTTTPDPSIVLLMHYWYGRVLEQTGEVAGAHAQYQRFLDFWGKADFSSPEIEDARARLAK
ncbi:MAG: protein kinase [Archangium sp.]|nr:protein kinase [Archangium sp.]